MQAIHERSGSEATSNHQKVLLQTVGRFVRERIQGIWRCFCFLQFAKGDDGECSKLREMCL